MAVPQGTVAGGAKLRAGHIRLRLSAAGNLATPCHERPRRTRRRPRVETPKPTAFVTFPIRRSSCSSPLPGGRPADGHRPAGGRHRGRPGVPDAAGRHRLGQDLHDGQRDRAHRAAGDRFAPNKTLAAQLYSEFREFFPKNAVEYFVSYYDYYQPEAYVPRATCSSRRTASINEHIEQMRLSATKSLPRGATWSSSPRSARSTASATRDYHADGDDRARGRQDRPARRDRA